MHSPTLLVIISASYEKLLSWPATTSVQKTPHLCHQTCKEIKCDTERAWSIRKRYCVVLHRSYQNAENNVDGLMKEALCTSVKGRQGKGSVNPSSEVWKGQKGQELKR